MANIGVGVIVQYDSRDTQFYPGRGLFFSFSATDREPLNRHFSRFGLVKTDLRQYVSVYRSLIFAWQLVTQWAIGDNIPKVLLPTLGGEDLLRGLPQNMFRDEVMYALQAEMRFPVYRMLRGTVFAGAGDVNNLSHWQWAMPKIGYGLGLRVSINRLKVNIRFDVARNNLQRRWNTLDSYSFYFTAIEAF